MALVTTYPAAALYPGVCAYPGHYDTLCRPVSQLSDILDDFSDGVVGSQWTATGSWSESGGAICSTGSFSKLETRAFDMGSGIWVQAIIPDGASGTTWFQVDDAASSAYANLILDASGALVWRLADAAGAVTHQGSVPYDPGVHGWQRIYSDGVSLFWQTSANGLNWQTLDKTPLPAWTSNATAVIQTSYTAAPFPCFDNFNVPGTAAPPVPIPGRLPYFGLGDGGDGHSISFHDRNGTPVVDVPCRDIRSVAWSRELSEVSRTVITGNAFTAPEPLEQLHPWAHHASVFRDGLPVWTGIIQVIQGDRDSWQVTARDYGCLMWRTATPIARQWRSTDPARMAADLFNAMYGHHLLPDAEAAVFPTTAVYDYEVTAKRQRMDQAMSDLVKLGVDWTVFRGRPVVMPTIRTKTLLHPVGWADCHFSEELKVKRDGTRFYTDIILRGKNFTARATRDVAGLLLQDVVAMDDLFGADNIRKAADQLVARRSAIRLQVIVPSGATLSPDSDVGINELMPGAIFPVYTELGGGVSTDRKLEKLECQQDASGETVSVTLGEVPEQAAETEIGD